MDITGVMLGSENAPELGKFYEKVFGKPSFMDGEWFGFGKNDSGLMIGPHSEVKGKNQDSPRIMLSFTCQDVKAEFERLKGIGAGVVAEPYQPSAKDYPDTWLATLSDPDNNYIQLSTPWEA